MQCKEMKRPLSPQLAVIIANISAMFPPGKPETTNNKGQNFLQIQHFLLMLKPRLPLIGCVVCSLESKCQDTVHVCVCLLIIFFAGLKKRKSSIRGLPAERRHAQLERMFTSISLYHPSHHILLSPCETHSLVSDGHN